jgi:hypothetical protein
MSAKRTTRRSMPYAPRRDGDRRSRSPVSRRSEIFHYATIDDGKLKITGLVTEWPFMERKKADPAPEKTLVELFFAPGVLFQDAENSLRSVVEYILKEDIKNLKIVGLQENLSHLLDPIANQLEILMLHDCDAGFEDLELSKFNALSNFSFIVPLSDASATPFADSLCIGDEVYLIPNAVLKIVRAKC